MSRKNPKPAHMKGKTLYVKEAGFSKPVHVESIGNFKAVGNFRFIENFIGIRMNTDDKSSKFYAISIKDIEIILQEPLSVANIYEFKNRYSDEKSVVGAVKISKSQRSVKLMLNNSIYYISRKNLEYAVQNITYIGNVLSYTENKNSEVTTA